MICGDCFRWAYDNQDKGVLVHAVVHHPWSGKSFDHAWIEKGNRVYDWQSVVKNLGPGKKGWKKEDFYKAYNPILDIKRYTQEEAVKNIFKTRHYGPW